MERISGGSIHIVVAEDNPGDWLILKTALQETNPQIQAGWACDGEDLINYLESQPAADMIMLDMNMPRKNGLEVLAQIRKDPRFSHIPVVMLTSSNDEKDILRSYKLGVNTFIQKPYTYRDLKEKISAFIAYWLNVSLLPPKTRAA